MVPDTTGLLVEHRVALDCCKIFLGLTPTYRAVSGESLAVSCKTWDRDFRFQSLIFFEQYYYLAVKLMPQIFTSET